MAEQAWEANLRYEALRLAAREATREKVHLLADDPIAVAAANISLTEISEVALRQWSERWTAHPCPHGGNFDWPRLRAEFRPYINRFEVAVWAFGTLCGMALGRPSSGRDNLTLHFLERYWGENPLAGSVASIVFDAADNYARVLGRQWLKIKNPFSGAIPRYERLGFSVAQGIGQHTYYAREITYD